MGKKFNKPRQERNSANNAALKALKKGRNHSGLLNHPSAF
jgi:hypothetical protein